MSSFDGIISGALDAVREITAATITYRRGANSVSASASVGESVYQVQTAEGVVVEHESRDFMIAVAVLILDGSNVTPREGDEIEQVIDGSTVTFEVGSEASGQAFEFSDPNQTEFRVHTKRISTT
jgi:hypothetical protein